MENELSRITLEQADGTWIAAAAGRVDKDGLSANCEARDSDPLTAIDDPDVMLETLDILADKDTMAAIREAEAGLSDEARWTGKAQGY
jgi:hypothetical protein